MIQASLIRWSALIDKSIKLWSPFLIESSFLVECWQWFRLILHLIIDYSLKNLQWWWWWWVMTTMRWWNRETSCCVGSNDDHVKLSVDESIEQFDCVQVWRGERCGEVIEWRSWERYDKKREEEAEVKVGWNIIDGMRFVLSGFAMWRCDEKTKIWFMVKCPAPFQWVGREHCEEKRSDGTWTWHRIRLNLNY